MISKNNLRGVVHGKMIQLSNDPGLADGQEVEVTLRTASLPAAWGEGLHRAAGALADTWCDNDDAILDQLQQDRLRSSGRELPS
jgi:hypothetical protein